MQPPSLSASALQVYSGCPARFNAEYVKRVHDLSGQAASKGTVCHAYLEELVKSGWRGEAMSTGQVAAMFEPHYYALFASGEHYDECMKMLGQWHARTGPDYWAGREVLSTESKQEFMMKAPDDTEVPLRYIFDRMDRVEHKDSFEIEVVDYKSVALPVTPDDLKGRIQPRIYGLAAQLLYPEADGIWVTYDLLRYDQVSFRFKKEDNRNTYRWLKAVIADIWNDDGETERLNPECRFCIRKNHCLELLNHVDAGGILSVNDLHTAADMRARLDWARGALSTQITQLDDFILAECEEQDLLEFKTGETEVTVGISSRRAVDSERASKILGPELTAKYGTIGVTQLDKILKEEDISDDDRAELRGIIRKPPGAPKIKTKPIKLFEEEE